MITSIVITIVSMAAGFLLGVYVSIPREDEETYGDLL